MPLPTKQKASNTPRPGPGLDSIIKKMDFPSSWDSWIPIGLNTPWLIALFKNNTFAGSTKIDTSGIRPKFTINSTPPRKISFKELTTGPTIA